MFVGLQVSAPASLSAVGLTMPAVFVASVFVACSRPDVFLLLSPIRVRARPRAVPSTPTGTSARDGKRTQSTEFLVAVIPCQSLSLACLLRNALLCMLAHPLGHPRSPQLRNHNRNRNRTVRWSARTRSVPVPTTSSSRTRSRRKSPFTEGATTPLVTVHCSFFIVHVWVCFATCSCVLVSLFCLVLIGSLT